MASTQGSSNSVASFTVSSLILISLDRSAREDEHRAAAPRASSMAPGSSVAGKAEGQIGIAHGRLRTAPRRVRHAAAATIRAVTIVVERPGPRGRAAAPAPLGRAGQPVDRLTAEGSDTPVPRQREMHADRPIGVRFHPPVERSAQVVDLGIQPVHPLDHVRARAAGARPQRQIEEEAEVGSPRDIGFLSFDQSVAGVLADGLEQAVARGFGVIDLYEDLSTSRDRPSRVTS